MSDTDATPRLTLPLLSAGQAQKEMTHNEALALIDLLIQAAVVGVGVDAPPANPAPGQAWVVGTAPGGEWAGHSGAVAGWTGSGWRFVAPREGMTAWSEADGCDARFRGGAWTIGDVAGRRVTVNGVPVLGSRQPAIVAPAGGTTIDVQARDAIAAILTGLRAHGLIAS